MNIQLSKLQAVIDFAWDNKISNWYKEFYKKNGILQKPVLKSIDEIKSLPLITRENMESVPLFDRAFLPIKEATEIRTTSGTTGKKPFFYLRNTYYKVLAKKMYDAGSRRKLMFWSYNLVPGYPEWDRLCGIQTIICDPHQMQKSVSLIEQASIDTLYGTPSILLLFGKLLKDKGINNQIKFLDLQGEPCSIQSNLALRILFPNAGIFAGYAMGEIAREMGIRTPKCDSQDGNYYHANTDDYLIEQIDGELVTTCTILPNIMPLIRYKTGDHIKLMEHQICSCGYRGPSFTLLGRTNVDFVRVAGVELRASEIAKVISQFSTEVSGFVSSKVFDSVKGSQQSITLVVSVVPLNFASSLHTDLKERIKSILAKQLKVSATTNLESLIKAGLFKEIQVKFLEEEPVNNKAVGIKLVAQ